MLRNEKGIALIFVIFIVFALILGLFVFIYSRYGTANLNQNNQGAIGSPEQYAEENNENSTGEQVFFPYILNFDNLSIEDLPNFQDVRSVDNYKGHLLIIGFSKIVEYDPTSQKIIRASSKVIPTIDSGALIGDTLYVSSNRANPDGENIYGRQMFMINMQNGKIVKKFFENDEKKFVNLMLAAKDGFLWGSSWSGVFRMDPKTEEFVWFDNQALGLGTTGLGDDGISGVYVEDGKVHVMINTSRFDGIDFSVYNEATNTWQTRAETYRGEYASKVNKNLSDFGLDLPFYEGISHKVNDKYYLVSDKGVHLLKKNEMPQLLFRFEIKGIGDGTEMLVSEDEQYGVLVGKLYGMIPDDSPLEHQLTVKVIDLKTREIFDLIDGSSLCCKELTLEQKKILDQIDVPDTTEYSINDKQVLVKNKKTGEQLLVINYRDHTFQLGEGL